MTLEEKAASISDFELRILVLAAMNTVNPDAVQARAIRAVQLEYLKRRAKRAEKANQIMAAMQLPDGGQITLRRCPWCRGYAQGLYELTHKDHVENVLPSTFQIYCLACEARGPERESQELSALAWNMYGK
jgi:hypothetical protein